MVDQSERNTVRDAILAYMRGEIDNFAFDDRVMSTGIADESVRRIGIVLWSTYDDLMRHPISVDSDGWRLYRRCAAFCQTSLEMLPEQTESHIDKMIWPFPSWRALYRHRRAARLDRCPQYDPSIHSVTLRTRFQVALMNAQLLLYAGVLLFLLGRLVTIVAGWLL